MGKKRCFADFSTWPRARGPWRRRYHASPVEPGQWVLAAMCFIERLPIEAGLAVAAYHYPHSSYRTRLGKTDHYPLTDPPEYRRLGDTLVDRAAAPSSAPARP